MEPNFEFLKGQTIKLIEGLEKNSESVKISLVSGIGLEMYHYQGCCERVSVEDIIGDTSDIVGHEILLAEEVTSDQNPEGIVPEFQDSFTWTFYKLSTIKGSITIRWYGESNGYYSERVSLRWC